MARLAKSSSVTNLKPKFRELRKRLDMIGMYFNAMALSGANAACLARPIIAGEHGLAPCFVFGRVANPKMLWGYAAFPLRVSRASECGLLYNATHFPPLAQCWRWFSKSAAATFGTRFLGSGKGDHPTIWRSARNIVAHQKLSDTTVRDAERSPHFSQRDSSQVHVDHLLAIRIKRR